jgi:hypothetical protein
LQLTNAFVVPSVLAIQKAKKPALSRLCGDDGAFMSCGNMGPAGKKLPGLVANNYLVLKLPQTRPMKVYRSKASTDWGN